ncbi:eCIS core domain-containing protein [Streptomyces sp. RPT161]|uniref:eCIS core domain-containing protein n=1 Tax=Streptomyces sp. RPT161 TaxID=3015993 RepID=UPI003FCDC454
MTNATGRGARRACRATLPALVPVQTFPARFPFGEPVGQSLSEVEEMFMRAHGKQKDQSGTSQRSLVAAERQRQAAHIQDCRSTGWTPATVAALQRTAGNAAMQRALAHDQHTHGPGCGHQEVAPVQRSTVPDVLRGPGKPLDDEVRADMEGRFGEDFSDVRVHTGPAAQRSAAEIGARAYTSGNHVVIGEGGADRHTLAHELTHVIQQRQGPVAGTDNGDGLKVSDPSDRFEREAEAQAHRVLRGPSPVQRAQAAGLGGTVRQSTAATMESVQRVHYEPGATVTAHPGFSVTLQATLNGVTIGTFSSETTPYSPGDHAEDQLVDEIEATIAGMYGNPAVAQALAAGQGGVHALAIHLTASPCSSARRTCTKVDGAEGCAERLIALAQHGYSGHRFAISVRAHHLYQPRLNGVDAQQASAQAVADMRSAGINVTIG